MTAESQNFTTFEEWYLIKASEETSRLLVILDKSNVPFIE